MADRISAPTVTWSFIFSNSAGVSFPGLFKNVFGNGEFASVMKQSRCLDRLE